MIKACLDPLYKERSQLQSHANLVCVLDDEQIRSFHESFGNWTEVSAFVKRGPSSKDALSTRHEKSIKYSQWCYRKWNWKESTIPDFV